MAQSVLHVASSALFEGSVSRAVAQEILTRLDAGSVVTRDLAKGPLPFVDQTWVGGNFTPAEQRSDDHVKALTLSETLIGEVEAADTLVIGVPTYNFNIPASLKAWVDQITRARRTFHYGESGPVGHLTGKTAILAYASGGTPAGSAMDYGTPYLKMILGFVGITDVRIVDATGWAKLSEDEKAARLSAMDEAPRETETA